MSKEMREQINKVKNWKQFLSESLKRKLSFLEGKPISLIKTLHTVGRWNDEKREMDRVARDGGFVDGIIGQIGDYEGSETPGFWVMDNNGKRKSFVMYDEKTGEFVDGTSIFRCTYRGKTEKDNTILQFFLDDSSYFKKLEMIAASVSTKIGGSILKHGFIRTFRRRTEDRFINQYLNGVDIVITTQVVFSRGDINVFFKIQLEGSRKTKSTQQDRNMINSESTRFIDQIMTDIENGKNNGDFNHLNIDFNLEYFIDKW